MDIPPISNNLDERTQYIIIFWWIIYNTCIKYFINLSILSNITDYKPLYKKLIKNNGKETSKIIDNVLKNITGIKIIYNYDKSKLYLINLAIIEAIKNEDSITSIINSAIYNIIKINDISDYLDMHKYIINRLKQNICGLLFSIENMHSKYDIFATNNKHLRNRIEINLCDISVLQEHIKNKLEDYSEITDLINMEILQLTLLECDYFIKDYLRSLFTINYTEYVEFFYLNDNIIKHNLKLVLNQYIEKIKDYSNTVLCGSNDIVNLSDMIYTESKYPDLSTSILYNSSTFSEYSKEINTIKCKPYRYTDIVKMKITAAESLFKSKNIDILINLLDENTCKKIEYIEDIICDKIILLFNKLNVLV